MKKILTATLLAFIMMTATFAGCGSNDDANGNNDSATDASNGASESMTENESASQNGARSLIGDNTAGDNSGESYGNITDDGMANRGRVSDHDGIIGNELDEIGDEIGNDIDKIVNDIVR